jgi:hypothetical protein
MKKWFFKKLYNICDKIHWIAMPHLYTMEKHDFVLEEGHGMQHIWGYIYEYSLMARILIGRKHNIK